MSPSQRTVLAVFAHPDDELFHGGGWLAHLAERGMRVVVACATKGEAGKPHPSMGPVSDLGDVRAEELRASCEILGLEPPRFLGFRDSARKERLRVDDPRALHNVDMLEVERAVLGVIGDVEADMVLTFDPHGGYYHPDHIAVHRAVTAAFWSSGAFSYGGPTRLIYSVIAEDTYRRHAEATRGWGVTDGLDPQIFGVSASSIALRFDARPFLSRKLRAFAAHQSAFGVTAEMLASPPEDAARLLRGFAPLLEEEAFAVGGVRGDRARLTFDEDALR